MLNEINSAVTFWTSKLSTSASNSSAAFAQALTRILEKRYEGHWHVSNSLKGNAYRSIIVNRRYHTFDASLREAAKEAGLTGPMDSILTRFCGIMWIDPGCVEVENYQSHAKETLYINEADVDWEEAWEEEEEEERVEHQPLQQSVVPTQLSASGGVAWVDQSRAQVPLASSSSSLSSSASTFRPQLHHHKAATVPFSQQYYPSQHQHQVHHQAHHHNQFRPMPAFVPTTNGGRPSSSRSPSPPFVNLSSPNHRQPVYAY